MRDDVVVLFAYDRSPGSINPVAGTNSLQAVSLPQIRVHQLMGVPTISEVDSDRIRHVPKKGTAILTGFLAGNDCQRERLKS